MVNVAIAGGTGGIGRTLTEAIVATGKHKVFVLSRGASKVYESNPAVEVLVVDYTDVAALKSVLESYNIHTVLSTLIFIDPGSSQAQLNLIAAADASSSTKRFSPSEYGFNVRQCAAANFNVPFMQPKLDALAALEKTTTLEYTSYLTGAFMDYFGMPHIPSYLNVFNMFVDLKNRVAAVPGKGETPVAFTYTADIGAIVAASLDLPKWEKISYIIGDKLPVSKVVEICKSVRGGEWDVGYNTVEELAQGQIKELPSNAALYSDAFPKQIIVGLLADVGHAVEEGFMDLPRNDKITAGEINLAEACPSVKPLKVRELVEKAWAGKD